jgi:hypothetical protein
MRLNGWQRIGIVCSGVWALFAVGYVRVIDSGRAFDTYGLMLRLCIEGRRAAERASCDQPAVNDMNRAFEGEALRMALVAVVPVVLVWILVYFGLWLTRWIRAGFKTT